MKHTNTLCGWNSEFQYVKAGGTYKYTDHWASKGCHNNFENSSFIHVENYCYGAARSTGAPV
jgi:hypothetical protein